MPELIPHPLPGKPSQSAGRRASRRIAGMHVLWALVLTFVAMPFLESIVYGQLVEAALLTLVLSLSVVAVATDRWSVICVLALAVPAAAGKWTTVLFPGTIPPEAFLPPGLLCIAFVAWRFLRYIMSATRVDTHVLCAGIASFFMLALAWAFAYVLLDRAQPGSFQLSGGADSGSRMVGFTAVYFSMVTLCTVGFGDITPVSSPARMLAMMEGATGVFFVAVMVARLVSMYSSRQPGTDAGSASS